MKADRIEARGTVEKLSRGDLYTISVQHGEHRRTVLAKRSGFLIQRHIRVVPGDEVLIELSPYDTTRGRITRRL
jgi:translation initiation factor IF-1